MKKSDKERLKKIVSTWENLSRQMQQPWNMVAGLRHRLVHDYDGINWTIIVEVVFSDLDPFVDAVREILAGM